MVLCNPRDREAAHRAEMEGIATDDPAAVTCRKCRELLHKLARERRERGTTTADPKASPELMNALRRERRLLDSMAQGDRSVVRLGHELADPGPSPSAPVRQRERAVALADQLAKLKPDDRDVIVLRNLQGLSFEEVAERMGRKPGAVRMLWLRAIERFRQIYEANPLIRSAAANHRAATARR